jgi:hypothetical protein
VFGERSTAQFECLALSAFQGKAKKKRNDQDLGRLVLVSCDIAASTPPAYYPVIFRGPYLVNLVGEFILGTASCLDAFSAYPDPA